MREQYIKSRNKGDFRGIMEVARVLSNSRYNKAECLHKVVILQQRYPFHFDNIVQSMVDIMDEHFTVMKVRTKNKYIYL